MTFPRLKTRQIFYFRAIYFLKRMKFLTSSKPYFFRKINWFFETVLGYKHDGSKFAREVKLELLFNTFLGKIVSIIENEKSRKSLKFSAPWYSIKPWFKFWSIKSPTWTAVKLIGSRKFFRNSSCPREALGGKRYLLHFRRLGTIRLTGKKDILEFRNLCKFKDASTIAYRNPPL